MNWVDIVIIVLVLGLAFLGYRKGVISIVFTLVGFIVGLVLAGRLWEQVADAIPIGSESIARIVGFVVILAVVMVAAWIAARILKTVLKVLLLGWVDGLAGAAIGAVIGALTATAIVSAAGIVPSDSVKRSVEGSTLAGPLVKNTGVVYAFLPDEFGQVKNLLARGRSLLDQGAALIESSGQIQQLISQGSGLLEQAGNLQDLMDKAQSLTGNDSGVVVGFNGLTAFEGRTIYAMVSDANDDAVGPLTTKVLQGGVAVLAIDGIEDDTAYTVSYYIDGNDNGMCNDADDEDVKGTVGLAAGATQAGVAYEGNAGSGNGVCQVF